MYERVIELAARYPSSPVFKIPQLSSQGSIESWQSISYEHFLRDVESHARYWTSVFKRDRIPQRSVIGIWVSGFTYGDVLHIYGISRAGYIPQLFSLRLPNPEVIYELLHRANAQALVYAQTFESVLQGSPVPVHPAVFGSSASDHSSVQLPQLSTSQDNDLAFIFHTSGSTSGSPKLVPCNYRWLNTVVDKSNRISTSLNPNSQRQDVTVMMGSMCHIAQTTMLIGSLQHGSCVIQPTELSFSVEELVGMIHQCGLNRLNQFGSFLGNNLRASRSDPKLLSLLATLDEICYSGLPLSREDEEWGYTNGLRLRNLYGSTELSAMLFSVGGSGRDARLLRSFEGYSYRFIPTSPAASDSGHQSTARLLELVIPSESPDCPDVSLRHVDGDFHTGDLFQEASPGLYVFRGRDDDWIKSENSLRCDTKAIEDNALTVCGNLVAECIVVGSGRPSPVMFIEPGVDMDHGKLKKEIIRKTRHFHSRRYLHERIISPDMIVIVPRHSLPRTATKGNIRRKAVEEAYKPLLDQIYSRLH